MAHKKSIIASFFRIREYYIKIVKIIFPKQTVIKMKNPRLPAGGVVIDSRS
jgi:hypothetical protein